MLIIEMMYISNETQTPQGNRAPPQQCSKTCVFLCQVNTRSVFLFFLFFPLGSVILAKVVSTAKAVALYAHEQFWSLCAPGRRGEATTAVLSATCRCSVPGIMLRHEGRVAGRNGDTSVASLLGDFGFTFAKGGQQWGDRPLKWGYTASREGLGGKCVNIGTELSSDVHHFFLKSRKAELLALLCILTSLTMNSLWHQSHFMGRKTSLYFTLLKILFIYF